MLCCARRSEATPLVGGGVRSRCCCRPAACVAVTAGISGLCFGYEIGIVDGVMAMDSFRLFFGTAGMVGEGLDITPTGEAAAIDGSIVSLFLCGCCLGSVLASYGADAWGRKSLLLLGSLFFSLGGVLQAMAGTRVVLYLGRLLAGCGIGLLSMVAPLFINEVAEKDARGALISMQQLLITVGIFLASCANSALYKFGGHLGDLQWRTALLLQVLPALLLLGATAAIPPSPRWLVLVGRVQQAHEVVALLRQRALDDPAVASEVEGIQEELCSGAASAGEAAGSGSGSSTTSVLAWALRFRALLSRGNRKRTLVVCLLQFFQQWSGINAILYFAAALFLRAGVGKDTAATTLVVCNSALLVVGTVPGMWAVDRESIGRRRLLLYGSAAMAACHCAIALLVSSAQTAQAGTPRADALSYAAVAAMMLFTFSFSATWGPVAWVVSSEVFDLDVRAQGVALGTLVNWASNAVIGKVVPLLVEAWGGNAFFLFFACCAASGAYVHACLPETTGVSLQDMGSLFGEERGIVMTKVRTVDAGSASAEYDEQGLL